MRVVGLCLALATAATADVGDLCGLAPADCQQVRCPMYDCPGAPGSYYGCANKCWISESDGSCNFWKPLCTCPGQPACPACPPRVRRAWSSLSCPERKRYIDAVALFKSTHAAEFNDFVSMHVTAWDYAHSTSAFLPWHRYYLIGWENALRSLGGEFSCLTVPYWDWEHDAGSEASSSVLRSSTFGTAAGIAAGTGCVTNGVAAAPGWSVTGGTCLVRRNGQASWWGFTDEAGMAALIMGQPTYAGFRPNLEGNPHAAPHVWIGAPGGHLATAASPEDPLFFVHHANVDRMWALWQDYHGYDTATAASQYTAATSSPTPLSALQLTSVMPMPITSGSAATMSYFSVPYTIQDMIDLDTIPGGNTYTYGKDNLAWVLGSPLAGSWNWAVPQSLTPFECLSKWPGEIAVWQDFKEIVKLTPYTRPTRYEAVYDIAYKTCREKKQSWRVPKWFEPWAKKHGMSDLERFYPCGTLPPRELKEKTEERVKQQTVRGSK